MSTVEMILQKASELPDPLQREALHYVDYLLARQLGERESGEWTRFSAEQLAGLYAASDAIYDEDSWPPPTWALEARPCPEAPSATCDADSQ